MPVGSSGRVVIEMDPDLKRELHAALGRNKLTLKDWFIRNAQRYVTDAVQPSLFVSENLPATEAKRESV